MEDGGREVPGLGGLDRFEPDWRLYARSASDDKSPSSSLCCARRPDRVRTETHVQSQGHPRRRGRSGLAEPGAAIGRYRSKFSADAMLILDGPVHPSGKPTLVFGARDCDLHAEGVRAEVRTALGHYGNWVPNPATRLANCSRHLRMTTARAGRRFYAGIDPLRPEEQQMLDAVPDDPAQLKALFGISC